MNPIISYISENYLELTALVLSLIYVYLSINQQLSTWVFGFVCSVLYIVVFYQAKFYAGMGLQVYYAVISIYGWFSWKKANTQDSEGLQVSKIAKALLLKILGISAVLFVMLYYVLSNYTDSPIPVPDALTTAFGIVATWMLARKLIENWIFWIFIDLVSVVMFLYRGLYPTVILFVVYTVMAVAGYYRWKKSMQ